LVVIHDDHSVARLESQEGHEKCIPDLIGTVENLLKTETLVQSVEVQMRILPEPIGAGEVRELNSPLQLVVPTDA